MNLKELWRLLNIPINLPKGECSFNQHDYEAIDHGSKRCLRCAKIEVYGDSVKTAKSKSGDN